MSEVGVNLWNICIHLCRLQNTNEHTAVQVNMHIEGVWAVVNWVRLKWSKYQRQRVRVSHADQLALLSGDEEEEDIGHKEMMMTDS